MNKKIFSLLVLLAAATGAWAEEVIIGEGTGTTYYFPNDNFFNYSATQQIYTAEEIGMGGTITAISFYYNYGTAYTMTSFQMFLKHVGIIQISLDITDIIDGSHIHIRQNATNLLISMQHNALITRFSLTCHRFFGYQIYDDHDHGRHPNQHRHDSQA